MAAPAERLSILRRDDLAVVTFTDTSILDTMQIDDIGRQLNELVEKGGCRRMVLDFANVKFLSSATLGILLTLRRKCDEAAGRLAIAALRPELRRVFQVTRLDSMFTFYPDRATAERELALNPEA
ncbi:MAG TPA: STAS domain-containing protein [Phycisphaerae bacterium]|jgi:anti-anti-sigma factor